MAYNSVQIHSEKNPGAGAPTNNFEVWTDKGRAGTFHSGKVGHPNSIGFDIPVDAKWLEFINKDGSALRILKYPTVSLIELKDVIAHSPYFMDYPDHWTFDSLRLSLAGIPYKPVEQVIDEIQRAAAESAEEWARKKAEEAAARQKAAAERAEELAKRKQKEEAAQAAREEAAAKRAAEEEANKVVDETEDAIDVPSHLTLGQIEYYLTNAGLSLDDAGGKTYAEVREMVFQAGQSYPPLSEMVRVTLEERERELDRAYKRTQDIIDETGEDPYDAAIKDLDEAYGHDLDLIDRLISDTGYTLRTYLVGPMMGALGDSIAGAMGTVIDKKIGMPFTDGVPIGEDMAAQAPEVVKLGSPGIRRGYEKAERAVAEELDAHAQSLIKELTEKHSPITPDEATIAAGTIGAGSILGFVGLSAAGAAIEGATLGQMEIPGQFLLQLGGMYGLAKMAGSVISVPYHWGVEVGHHYKWASVFQPMVPGMSDLVRMEAREVWRDEFRKEQLEEPPSEKFGTYAAYQGYGKEHADSYWAAHWVLPTTGQAYEMFHRLRPGRVAKELEFTRENLYTLMRRADILKRYRDPLIAIAYDIPTRREIRMMVNSGDLTRDEAEQVYLDRGVDPKFAGKLADFAWSRAQRDPYRERVITACIGLAKEGFDTEDKFKERLKKRAVPAQVIADAWTLAELSYEFDYKRDLLAELREKLRKEKITIETFAAELSRIVPVAERANTIVERERARIKLEAS